MIQHDNPSNLTPYGKKIFSELTRNCEQILKSEENNTLPEDIFVNFFLPKFLREESHPGNLWISRWIHSCGGIGKAIDITSVETGKVLFTVPPILGLKGLTPDNREESNDFNTIITTFKSRLSGMPNPAQNYFNREMDEKYKYLVSKLDIREEVKQWLLVVLRYRAIKFTEDGKITYVPLEINHERLGVSPNEEPETSQAVVDDNTSPEEDLNDIFDL